MLSTTYDEVTAVDLLHKTTYVNLMLSSIVGVMRPVEVSSAFMKLLWCCCGDDDVELGLCLERSS